MSAIGGKAAAFSGGLRDIRWPLATQSGHACVFERKPIILLQIQTLPWKLLFRYDSGTRFFYPQVMADC